MKINELIEQRGEIMEKIKEAAFNHLREFMKYYTDIYEYGGEHAAKVTFVSKVRSDTIELKGEDHWRYGGYDAWTLDIEVADILDPSKIKEKIAVLERSEQEEINEEDRKKKLMEDMG